jgi:hypothetical protein
MTENRRRLTKLVAASTKLDAAACLAKAVTIDIAGTGLFSHKMRERIRRIADDLDACARHLVEQVEHIPDHPEPPPRGGHLRARATARGMHRATP